MTDILTANIISGLGVIHLIAGHAAISYGNTRAGFKFSAAGSLLVGISAIILASWPVFALNAVWLVLSLQGLEKHGCSDPVGLPSYWLRTISGLIPIVFLAGFIALVMGHSTLAAWSCTVIYLVGYYLLSCKAWPNGRYLLWTLLAFLLLISHLIETKQFMVLVNESIGAFLSLAGLIKVQMAHAKKWS